MYFRKMTLVCFGILAFAACSNDNKNRGIQAPYTQTNQNKDVIGLTGYVFQPSIPSDSLIGVSHVGHEPSLDQQTLDAGIATLLRLNVKSVFFYLTPQYREKYLKQDFGASNPRTLTALADLAPYQRAFAPFDIIVLTCTTDSFSTEGISIRDHYLTDEEYAANRKEFFDLTTYLMKTYNGTKKRFILKNWEGDWLLLNGYDEDAVVPDSRVTNFVRWFRSTQEGIAQARSAAATASDVKVDFALEMNRIGIVQSGKRNTFLGSVVPQVPSDWVSYSAWETISNRSSQNPQDPQSLYTRIVADLNDIKRRARRPLFVSEFGYAESGELNMQANRVKAAVRGFKDAGIPLAFYWNTYEKPYGLFKIDGKKTPNGAFEELRKEAMIEQVNATSYFSSPQATNVTTAYWNVLGRKPAASEFGYWVKTSAASNPALIHKIFAQSPEALRIVAQTYKKYTGVDPSEGTKQSLRAQLEGGSTIYDVGAALYLDKIEGRLALPSPAPTAAPTPTPMQAQVPSAGCVGSSLSPGKGLNVGQWLCSVDGRFLLSMQSDGNLVIYQGSAPIWASNTNGPGITSVQFQNDGNFVIYAGSRAVWATHTGGKGGQNISMQNDGNLVIYQGSAAIWASNTGGR